jgi:hypothetical protein
MAFITLLTYSLTLSPLSVGNIANSSMTDIPYLLIEHIAGLIILPEKAYFKIALLRSLKAFLSCR